uniref:hypothetical protein n=1 Tax=Staphylococcus haemolyticus TaxID=1283 RepID=UPI0016430955
VSIAKNIAEERRGVKGICEGIGMVKSSVKGKKGLSGIGGGSGIGYFGISGINKEGRKGGKAVGRKIGG